MTDVRAVARGLATVFLSGEWTRVGITQRVRTALNQRVKSRAVDLLVGRILRTCGEQPPPPRLHKLTKLILSEPVFHKYIAEEDGYPRRLNLARLPPPEMTPAPAIPGDWQLPSIVTPGALADWLGLSSSELEWFADCHGRERQRAREALRHYRYRWIPKRTGGRRLLEIPKQRLKDLQRTILERILRRIEPHAAAHAFRRGRSIASFAQPHSAKRVVLRIDLRHFFPSVQPSRIMSLFRTVGYPEAVARLLCGLCTNSVPDDILGVAEQQFATNERQPVERLYTAAHLPQGAPTSPALANLAAGRLDGRLSGLAAAVGGDYTRYADDLVFSGGRALERCLPRFRTLLLAIVLDEGFSIRHRKTAVMPAGGRQQVAGIVVNEHPNLNRKEFDRLKAILYNCAHHGPRSQLTGCLPQPNEPTTEATIEQLRSHLTGKVAYVRMINPAKGERLFKLLREIDWAG
ncbi:Reverse transcriptase (RNA-dependent DNA polymerase) [Symmachiella dynata]|uniref:reverse transcriptase family protein n=1 Tax=Symmachiella dynata TaxID=2527995 RepID=UPI0011896F2A|nr:reverse transcriptase family protein [Symmachiella dynata]QDT46587.1 Reverse transcriptase (RNA-dependent DNA polymerase) [Symmachiella dynata]